MNNQIKTFLDELNLKYNDINLYITSFTHTSYANEFNVIHNERLEFIGDAILDFLVGEYIYLNFLDMNEGKMSKLRAVYVCEDANKNYCLKLGLEKFLRIGAGEESQGGRNKKAVLADLFEAFLGALYIDNKSLSEVRKILEQVVFPSIVLKEDYILDYKSLLQEHMQAENRKGVTYTLDREEGPPHDKTFYVSVYFEDIKLGSGVGKNKKEAQMEAAKIALKKLVK